MLQMISQPNGQDTKNFHATDRMLHQDTNPSDPAIFSLLLVGSLRIGILF
jgi:hypothetical protein